MTERADILITGGLVVTLDEEDRRYDPGTVAIRGNRIVQIGRSEDVAGAFDAPVKLDASGKLVLPGFVNTHTHLFQTFIKGLGNILPLHAWIKQVPVPTLLGMDERSMYSAAMIGSIGALRSGTTTLLDHMYPNPRPQIWDALVQGLWDCGIRATLGRGVADIPSEQGYPVTGYHPSLLEPLDAALEHCARLFDRCTKTAGGRVRVCVAPPNMRTVSDTGLRALRDFARDHRSPISMHLCESVRDDEIARDRYGKDAVDWLDSLELLGDNFVAVHCVKLRPAAIEVFSSRRVNVSFNPVSNMFVGNGIAPIAALRGSGVRVTLGTDGAGVNNNDLLETMKVAALLVRVATEDPDTIRAGDVVRMATIEGARALGLGDEIGSLEAGKRADLTLFDLRNSRSSPHHDPLDSLVFSTNTQAVDSVMVDGRLLVADGQLVDRDERELVAAAQEQATTVARRNGLA